MPGFHGAPPGSDGRVVISFRHECDHLPEMAEQQLQNDLAQASGAAQTLALAVKGNRTEHRFSGLLARLRPD